MTDTANARDATYQSGGPRFVSACEAVLAADNPADLVAIGIDAAMAEAITRVAQMVVSRQYDIISHESHIATSAPLLELAREMPDEHLCALDKLIDLGARLVPNTRQRWYSFTWMTRVMPQLKDARTSDLIGLSQSAFEALRHALASHYVRMRVADALLGRADWEKLAEGDMEGSEADLLAAMVGRRSLLQFVRRAEDILDSSERLAFEKWASDCAKEPVQLSDV